MFHIPQETGLELSAAGVQQLFSADACCTGMMLLCQSTWVTAMAKRMTANPSKCRSPHYLLLLALTQMQVYKAVSCLLLVV